MFRWLDLLGNKKVTVPARQGYALPDIKTGGAIKCPRRKKQ
jgi:hypothetical protein